MNPSRTFANCDIKVIGLKSSEMENTWVMDVPGILSVDQVYSPLLTMSCRDRRPLRITRMQTPSTPGWEKDLAQPTFSA